MPAGAKIYEMAGGNVIVRLDQWGAICIKTVDQSGDRVEMALPKATRLVHGLTIFRFNVEPKFSASAFGRGLGVTTVE